MRCFFFNSGVNCPLTEANRVTQLNVVLSFSLLASLSEVRRKSLSFYCPGDGTDRDTHEIIT